MLPVAYLRIAMRLTRTSSNWHAYAAIIGGLVFLSLGPVWTRFAQGEGMPSLLLAFLRMTIATLILTPFVIRRYSTQLRQLKRRDLYLAAASGLWMSISFVTFFAALEHTSVMMNEVIGNSSPLWVALLEVFVFKARLRRNVWIGLALALGGGIVIALAGTTQVSLGRNPLLGGLFSLTGAVTYAIYLITARTLRAKVALLPYVWMVYGCSAIITLVGVIIGGIPITGYSAAGYLWVLALALGPQLIGHSAFNYSLRYLPVTFVSVAGQGTIITSGIFGLLLFQEVPHSLQIPASVAIVVGVLLVSQGQNPPHEPSESPK